MQLGNEHRARRARFARRELPAEPDQLIAGPNFDREHEIREFSCSKRQIWNNAFERALEIKQVEAAFCLRSPVRRASDISPEQKGKMSFLLSRWRDECASDFKNRNVLGPRANILFQHSKQTRDQARPQSDVIFAQRIAPFDCTFAERRSVSRN